MEKDKKIGRWKKAQMYVDKHMPAYSKHSLTGATYELKDVSPFAVDLSGAPRNKGLMVIMAALGFYIM